jgi:hypothetical protein
MNELDHPTEVVTIDSLRPHPRNYRSHPDDELRHIMESIRTNGIYRNVVISADNFILAGHGVVQALKLMGRTQVPVIRLAMTHDQPGALKVVVGDNEMSRLAMNDDRLLSEILKEIKDKDDNGLEGTGYDEAMLAALVYVTRPESEIKDAEEAKHWAGMPEFDAAESLFQVVVSLQTEEDKANFAKMLGVTLNPSKRTFCWWPAKVRDDLRSVRFEADQPQPGAHARASEETQAQQASPALTPEP